jgi:hypothetical protein
MKFDKDIQAIEEGIWDRAKANVAGVGGAVKGFGQRVAGGVKGAVAGATGDIAGAKAAAQQGKMGKAAGSVAKINSYRATAQQKIKKLTDEILGDLSKLGIDIKANPNIANGFIGTLNKGFDSLVGELQGSSPSTAAPAGATPPKLKPKSPAPAATTPASAATTPAPAATTPAPAPAAAVPPAAAASPSTPTPAVTAPTTPAPMDDKAIVDDLNKNKNEILGDNGLIGKAKYVAGQRGIGETGKAGVILLRSGPSGDEGVEQAKAELAKKYNVAPEKLVELLGQVFTESRKSKKHISTFNDLFKKI